MIQKKTKKDQRTNKKKIENDCHGKKAHRWSIYTLHNNNDILPFAIRFIFSFVRFAFFVFSSTLLLVLSCLLKVYFISKFFPLATMNKKPYSSLFSEQWNVFPIKYSFTEIFLLFNQDNAGEKSIIFGMKKKRRFSPQRNHEEKKNTSKVIFWYFSMGDRSIIVNDLRIETKPIKEKSHTELT